MTRILSDSDPDAGSRGRRRPWGVPARGSWHAGSRMTRILNLEVRVTRILNLEVPDAECARNGGGPGSPARTKTARGSCLLKSRVTRIFLTLERFPSDSDSRVTRTDSDGDRAAPAAPDPEFLRSIRVRLTRIFLTLERFPSDSD